MRVSLRSGRQHKAWGASPRITETNASEPAKRATAYEPVRLSPTSRARRVVITLILGLAPKALCCRPLCGLQPDDPKSRGSSRYRVDWICYLLRSFHEAQRKIRDLFRNRTGKHLRPVSQRTFSDRRFTSGLAALCAVQMVATAARNLWRHCPALHAFTIF